MLSIELRFVDLLLLVLGQYRLAQLMKPRSLCHPVEEHDRNVGEKLESMSGHMLSTFLKKWVSKFTDNYKFHIVFFCHMFGCCPESKQSSRIKHKEWYYGMEERQKQLLVPIIFIKYTKRQQENYRDKCEQNLTIIAWHKVVLLINIVSNLTQGENSIQFTNTLLTISVILWKLAYPWEIFYNFCT